MTIMVGMLLAIDGAGADEGQQARIVIAPQLQVFGAEEGEAHLSKRQAVTAGFEAYLRAHGEDFALIDEGRIQAALEARPLFDGTIGLARQWAQMGTESFKRLQTREAIVQLERAVENFDVMHYAMLEPGELAEILLYLSLSYLEEGSNVVRPLEVMKEMIGLDPTLVLRPGYYPEYIVHFYENARNALYQELMERGPGAAQARALAELVEADYVLYAFAFPSQSGPSRLVAYLYSIADDAFLEPEEQLLAKLDAEQLYEGASRLMSRYAACLFAPEPEAPALVAASRGDGPIAIQIQGAYASFLQYPSPIESSFGNYGVSVGLTYLLTREFGLTARLQILNSMRDYNGILREDFTTIRGFAGTRLTWQAGPLSIGLDTALELTSVGPIRAFGDKNCIPAPDVLCPDGRGTVVLDAQGALIGVSLRPQVGYRLTEAMEFVIATSVSYFFYPLTDRILNFPLSSEIGIQYRF